MSKTIVFRILGALVFFALLGVALFLGYQYQLHQKKLSSATLLNEALKKDLVDHQDKTMILTEENIVLKEQIVLLQDTIQMLREEIEVLQNLIATQKMTIKAQTLQLAQLRSEIRMIDRQMSTSTSDEAKLSQLRGEKNKLVKEKMLLSKSRDQDILNRRVSEQELMERQVREGRLSRIRNLVESTEVSMQVLEPRRSAIGRPLTRIRPGTDHWKYTHIQFDLSHNSPQLLLDESFMVAIVDKATGKALLHQGAQPESAHKGIQMTYVGEPLSMTHRNEGVKYGTNYELEIRYVDESGETYVLKNGRIPFIGDTQWVGSAG